MTGPKGDSKRVNYRMRGNYHVVDRFFAAAKLRLGTKQQQGGAHHKNGPQASAATASLFARAGR